MRLHDRYFLSELAGPILVSLVSVVLMMTVGQLFLLLDPRHTAALPTDIPLSSIGQYLLYRVPMMVQKSLPVALLVGCSLTLARMTHESELTAMRMGGLMLPRFLLPLAFVGVVAAIAAFVLAEQVSPGSDHRAEAIVRKLTFDTEVAGLESDTFFRSEDRIFYFHYSAPTGPGRMNLTGVVVYALPTLETATPVDAARAPGVVSRFWTADHAEVDGGVWTLRDTIEHQVSAEGEIVADHGVGSLRLDLHRNIQYFLANHEKPQELTAGELAERIRVDERLAVTPAVILPLRYEYAFRFALPFACLVFCLVAAPLAIRFARGGSLAGMLVAFGILFFYYDVLVIAEKLALNGAVPAELAAWIPNIIFGAIGAWMVFQEP